MADGTFLEMMTEDLIQPLNETGEKTAISKRKDRCTETPTPRPENACP